MSKLFKLTDSMYIDASKVSFIDVEKKIYSNNGVTIVRVVVDGAVVYINEIELAPLLIQLGLD